MIFQCHRWKEINEEAFGVEEEEDPHFSSGTVKLDPDDCNNIANEPAEIKLPRTRGGKMVTTRRRKKKKVQKPPKKARTYAPLIVDILPSWKTQTYLASKEIKKRNCSMRKPAGKRVFIFECTTCTFFQTTNSNQFIYHLRGHETTEKTFFCSKFKIRLFRKIWLQAVSRVSYCSRAQSTENQELSNLEMSNLPQIPPTITVCRTLENSPGWSLRLSTLLLLRLLSWWHYQASKESSWSSSGMSFLFGNIWHEKQVGSSYA